MADKFIVQLPSKKTGFDPVEFRATVKAVDAKPSDPDAFERLKKFLVDFSGLIALGDLQTMTLERIAERLGGGTSNGIILQASFEKLKGDYGYASAPPLERMLIDHIVLCGARLADTEWLYESASRGQRTFAQADFWERQLNHAQHRYLKAVETLARVRKLNINIQVNVAQNQIVTGS